MSADLTDQYIDDTFDGLLHMNGQPIPSTGKGVVYDGTGQASSLSVGLSGNGVDVAGTLKVGTVSYPSTNADVGSFLIHETPSTIGRLSKITSDYLADLSPSPSGTYSNIDVIKVNSKGQVTSVAEYEDDADYISVSRTFYRTSRLDLGSKNLSENTWASVSVSSISNAAKAVICFFEVDANYATDNGQNVTFYASSDDGYSNSYPILTLINDQGREIGNGAQFTIPVGSNKKFYITANAAVNTSSGSDLVWPVRIWLLAYQE